MESDARTVLDAFLSSCKHGDLSSVTEMLASPSFESIAQRDKDATILFSSYGPDNVDKKPLSVALVAAAEHGHAPVVHALLDDVRLCLRTEPSTRPCTSVAFYRAVVRGNTAVVDALMSHTRFKEKSHVLASALFSATKRGYCDIIQRLLSHDRIRRNEHGCIDEAIRAACRTTHAAELDVIFLNSPCKSYSKSQSYSRPHVCCVTQTPRHLSDSPFFVALQHNSMDVLRRLLSHWNAAMLASITAASTSQMTRPCRIQLNQCLRIAVRKGKLEIVVMLLEEINFSISARALIAFSSRRSYPLTTSSSTSRSVMRRESSFAAVSFSVQACVDRILRDAHVVHAVESLEFADLAARNKHKETK